MKKVIYILVIGSILMSCTDKKPHYVVNANIAGSDSITFYLKKREAGKIVSIDSAVSRNGSFTLKGGAIAYPQLVQLIAGNTKKRTSFYLENAEITIKGTLDSLFKAKVTGSKTEDEYQSYVKSYKVLNDTYAKFVPKYQAASQSGDVAGVARAEKQLDSIELQMTALQKNFVKSNPASYATPSLLLGLSYEMEADEIESMINGLDTAIAALPDIKNLKDHVILMKAVAVGNKAPDFTMNDINEKPVSLYSKLGPKLLLVDFWASWCNPCRQENPNVVKAYNEYHKKGFDILGVSLDQSKDNWLKAIADDKLSWTHVSDLQYWNNAAAKLYAVNAIPANFLLDDKGTIIGKNLRGEELANKIKEILDQKK